jgi:1-deoxy-D-xylulose-5-phosphate synthase
VLPQERTPIEFGKAEVLREGRDLVVCAVGTMVPVAWLAAKQLEEEGISVTLINARFIKPFDLETLAYYVGRTRKLITLEENVQIGGFGQQVRSALFEELRGISFEHRILAIPDRFIDHGAQALLREECGLCAEKILEIAKKFIHVQEYQLV